MYLFLTRHRVLNLLTLVWMGHAVIMGEERTLFRFLMDQPPGKRSVRNPVVDGRAGRTDDQDLGIEET